MATKKTPKTKKKTTKKRKFKIAKKSRPLLLFLLAVIVAAVAALLILVPRTKNPEEVRIYIPTGSTYDAVVDSLKAHDCMPSLSTFSMLSTARNYRNHVKGGSYVVKPEMSLLRLVNKLRSGNQDAIRLTINKQRTPQQLCDYLATKLEFSADSLLSLLQSDSVCASYGYTPQSIIAMFPQNTYDVYWTITPEKLLGRMLKESNTFWNEQRLAACQNLMLTTTQVVTLASIVEEETNQNEEKPLIASVYLNRFRKGMLLQADPTARYAAGDFTLQRITVAQTSLDSPYNTYRYKGLPPGPICIPSTASIDAVLENRQTNYLYFCAKEDFSGHHNFATTLAEHLLNAARFHKALNARGIK